MFDALSDRLERIAGRLRGRGRLSDADLDEALAEIRTALLEADVELGVVRGFVDAVRAQCTGAALSKSLTPGQQVIKAVHDELVRILGGETLKLTYASRPPTVVLLAGLQGSGKTTTAAKLAQWWKHQGRNPLLGRGRPAAPGRRRAAAGPRGPGRGHRVQRAHRPGRPGGGRGRRGPAPRPGRLHHRHRRAAGHRRRAHGRGAPDLCGHRAALHVAGHRRHDRPGRGGHGHRLPPDPRARRGDPDQA